VFQFNQFEPSAILAIYIPLCAIIALLCYLCVLVFRFPAWRWCIKSNLPALTVIVRCSAVPPSHSASTCLSSLCRRLCPRLPSSYLTPPVLCRTTECPPPASPHPCRLVLPSLRPLTSPLTTSWAASRLAGATEDVQPWCGDPVAGTILTVNTQSPLDILFCSSFSLTRQETCGENVTSFAKTKLQSYLSLLNKHQTKKHENEKLFFKKN